MPSSSHPGAAASPPPAPDGSGGPVAGRPPWTFLTNHGHVLLAVAQSQDVRVSEIAAQVGITTRATLTILKDLEDAGYLTRHRVGRRSHYTLDVHRHFRHPATAAHEVGELLAVFAPGVSRGTPDGT
ncbi:MULTISPECIES: winged helix-turn-helix domain-containing protein [Kocuria]|uniref:winged helix-turn-helix domain-containing protein n=1 Tax=Kocuria TaxID=57493 RepID=UPI0038CDA07F